MSRCLTPAAWVALWLSPLVFVGPVGAQEAEWLMLRAESLTVLPHSQPLLSVRVRNARDVAYRGRVSLQVPDSWRITPEAHDVQLAPREEQQLVFSVLGGAEQAANCYIVSIIERGDSGEITRHQQLSVASAPFFRPTIDGDPADWQDAIPVRFTVQDREVTIGTYWNRRAFCVLIAVAEDRLVRPCEAPQFDAVQLAISPQGTATGELPTDPATRFEYLLVAGPGGAGTCYQLITPGTPLSVAAEPRKLEPLLYPDAEVAVCHRDGVTYYECALPFAPMRETIRPGEGREFQFSVLVHDPDGTGIRDWGEAAGLWETQRPPLAWSRWIGAQFGSRPPLDCRTRWGMCSSRY